jgi:GNAT superfamily N-acetyltransferase
MHIEGPLTGVEADCERVLRTLPQWFGIEQSLLEYAHNTANLPTFVAKNGEVVVGFLSLREHFSKAWELDCIAVNLALRGQGLGKKLQTCAESWLVEKGVTLLQVKTLAPTHPSKAYAETRKFYEALGYEPVEVFPTLWGADLPVLQLVKALRPPP